jgi:hypothetical protein
MHRASVALLVAILIAACQSHAATCPPGETVDAPSAPAVPDAAPTAGDDDKVFTLVVIPDTQYLFDQDRGDASVLAASLHWIIDHADTEHIVFTAGLGDIVENHGPSEFASASATYQILDDARAPYSVLAGNHDVSNSGQYDDQRGAEPYLTYFPPSRRAQQPTYGGASPTGYDTYSIFSGGGQQWLLLSLDWRASASTIAWAKDVIHAHPTLPVILTTHELAYDGGDGAAALSDYGQSLWDQLIADEDQIVLTVNGHFWPPARAVLTNHAGHDVHVHIANYQDRYYGGSGMIRLYRFDLSRGTLEARTFSPYWSGHAPDDLNTLASGEVELSDARDRFIEPFDFAARFQSFQGGPPQPPPAVDASHELVAGTVAYWRFDTGTPGAPVPDTGVAVKDLSGHGNDLQRVTLSGGSAASLTWSADYAPAQPAHASLFFDGSKSNPAFGGAYLRTVDGAPLDAMTFPNGYTIETFLKLPADCCAAHAWMGAVSRMDTGGDAGRTGDDPNEPVATLSVTDGAGMQWAVYPTNVEGILTNWSHELPTTTWTHVAVVNDGHHTTMYIDGAPILRNPRAENIGISTTGAAWMVGAYAYAHVVDQSFYGWLGDVRIVDHALSPAQFMTAR